ncbi:MAG TPA: hypothetical protein VK737_01245 [Opitutales bacterium]|jgi:hypothetical protein|nr:hypothetical protein [Opitutales bacterium]
MKLVQKRPMLAQMEYEISDTALKISAQKRFSGTSFEIPYAAIRPDISQVRKFPIEHLVKAIILLGMAVLLLAAIVHVLNTPTTHTDSRNGFIVLIAVLAVLSFLLGFRFAFKFYVQKVDCFVINTRRQNPMLNAGPRRGSGRILMNQTLVIHRLIPNERHVTEFLDILKEKIDEAKFQNPPSIG